MGMRLRLLTAALIVISPMVSGCVGNIPAPASAHQSLASTNDAALASEAERPFAYVAETCGSRSSCPWPNGLVQILGGPTITTDVENPTALALDGSGNLYVGNSNVSNEGAVSVYAPKSVRLQRILSGLTGVTEGLIADAAGRLVAIAQYRSGYCQLGAIGAIYAAGAATPRQHLKGLSGFAHSPVLDKFGNLYIANFDIFPGWVSVYQRGRHVPSRFIQNGIGLPIQLAIAPNGDLVVANGLFSGGSNVVVYPAGKSTPSLTITAGVQSVYAVAVDADGNIYVANGANKKAQRSITVYRRGHKNVWRLIHSGITFPVALAFDSSGRLYVANVPRKGASSIAVYAAGGSAPVHTYALKEQFSALAVPH
jgi:sugar lactone lactonase YvrE